MYFPGNFPAQKLWKNKELTGKLQKKCVCHFPNST